VGNQSWQHPFSRMKRRSETRAVAKVPKRLNKTVLDFEVLHVDESFIIQGMCALAQILHCILFFILQYLWMCTRTELQAIRLLNHSQHQHFLIWTRVSSCQFSEINYLQTMVQWKIVDICLHSLNEVPKRTLGRSEPIFQSTWVSRRSTLPSISCSSIPPRPQTQPSS